MTKFVFDYSVLFLKNRGPLTCVWTETGNPRQPLACKWVAGPQQPGYRASLAADLAPEPRACA